MRILLAGATGAIGRPLVARLVAAGHDVTALTRRPDRVAGLEAAGARGAMCDVRDRDAVLRIAAQAAPDVVVDQTTDLPQRYDTRRLRGFYDAMTDLRLRGTPNLMDAADQTGARIVFQSLAFAYRPVRPPRLMTEDDALYGADAPVPWNLAMPVIGALEERAQGQGGLVLRYGVFYGPGTQFVPGGQHHDDIMRRRFPLPGPASGVFSFIHVDDGAAATVLALEHGTTGVLNVVDDTPMAVHDWLPQVARAIGGPRPLHAPLWLAKLVSAPMALHFALTLPGASNARAREELGWAPRHRSIVDGLVALPA
jgi:nucleoside-diphosphate-sugar epimerase